jgi:hypothetical protein
MFYSNPTGCTISFILEKFLALHVSDVTCVHHQEHNCSVQVLVLGRSVTLARSVSDQSVLVLGRSVTLAWSVSDQSVLLLGHFVA